MADDVTHPLNAVDAERSKARVADIELGLASADAIDRAWWRCKANERISWLEQDAITFGLVPHEEDELAQLKALIEKDSRRAG